MRPVSRALVLVAAALIALSSMWPVARAMAACVGHGGGTVSTAAFENEEVEESAALAPASIEIHRAAAPRPRAVVAARGTLRHRIAEDAELAARKWLAHRASPRAPPYRLLN